MSRLNGSRVVGPSYLRLPDSAPISDTDLQIIRLLQDDGRASFASLASELGMPERSVASRVAALVAQRVMKVSVVSNPTALGYRYGALIAVDCPMVGPLHETLERVIDLPSVTHAVATTGRFRFMVEGYFEAVAGIGDFLNVASTIFGPEARFDVHGYADISYLQFNYNLAGAGGEPATSLDETVPQAIELSTMDAAILQHLSEDGRESFRAIGRALGVSEGQIRQRYNRLTSIDAFRVQAVVNPRLLGYGSAAWLWITVTPGVSARDLAETLKVVPGVTYITVCLSRVNLIVEIIARTSSDLYRVLEDDVRMIPGVATIEPFEYLDALYKTVPPRALGAVQSVAPKG